MSQDKEKIEIKEGIRYNEGKPRYDLVPPFAYEKFVEILTKGALKYSERNWEKGMPWGDIISSLERHISEIKKGHDYDSESGQLHAAHVVCNAMFLLEYYNIAPHYDNRPHNYLRDKRIGLDIDDVLGDFIGHYIKHFKVTLDPTDWNFHIDMKKNMDSIKDNDQFWLDIPSKVDPSKLEFVPVCYITSRICKDEVTLKWLEKNHFPLVPVFNTKNGKSKSQIAIEQRLTIFVDDNYDTFVDINKNTYDVTIDMPNNKKKITKKRVCCYLMTTPQNERFKVGHKRIYNIHEIDYSKRSK